MRLAFLTLLPLPFFGCEQLTEVDIPAPQEAYESSGYHESEFYSPSQHGRDDEIGTRVTTFFTETATKEANGLAYTRKFDSVQTAGFHRNTMASELAWRSNLKWSSQGFNLTGPTGFENFDREVIVPLKITARGKIELSSPAWTAQFVPDFQDNWALRHLLRGKVKLMTSLDTLKGKKLPGGWSIDSARAFGLEKSNVGECLHYTVWYKRSDSILAIQMAFQAKKVSKKLADENKDAIVDGGFSKVEHSVYINPKTGWTCKEDSRRTLEIRMKDTVAKVVRAFDVSSAYSTVWYRD